MNNNKQGGIHLFYPRGSKDLSLWYKWSSLGKGNVQSNDLFE